MSAAESIGAPMCEHGAAIHLAHELAAVPEPEARRLSPGATQPGGE